MTKRTLSVLLALAMLCALLLPAIASADTSTYYIYSANGKSVNVREEPSTSAKRVGSLAYGASVQVVFFNATGWADILYNGHERWIMAKYLVENKPSPHKQTAQEKYEEEKKEEAKKLKAELASEKDVDEPFYVVVVATRATGWINFRVSPGKLTKRVASYQDGKELKVIGETNRWYKCEDPATGKVGYIFKDYTTKIAKPVETVESADGSKKQLGKLNVNGDFNIQCELPTDYDLQVVSAKNSSIIASITSTDPTKPQLYLSIAYEDTYADVERMNDMSEEDLKELENSFTQMNQVDISYRETTYGTKLLVARETGADTDFVDILSVYKGYLVEFNMTPNPSDASQTLTDEQVAMCIQFLSNVDFVPAAN